MEKTSGGNQYKVVDDFINREEVDLKPDPITENYMKIRNDSKEESSMKLSNRCFKSLFWVKDK